ncbi:MAG: hypothetical protein FWG94_13390 [Oscillospiraceae bacterium]|nr:hypothetical protein [Oscillospiraceae bacterium]
MKIAASILRLGAVIFFCLCALSSMPQKQSSILRLQAGISFYVQIWKNSSSHTRLQADALFRKAPAKLGLIGGASNGVNQFYFNV